MAMTTKFYLIVVIAIALTAFQYNAEGKTRCVVLFEDADFEGARKEFCGDNSCVNGFNEWNDRASSYSTSDAGIIGYTDDECKGGAKTFIPGGHDSNYLGDGWNDKLSSIKFP